MYTYIAGKNLTKHATKLLTNGVKSSKRPAAQWDENLYMTEDFDHASIDYKQEYADAGFSSMVNFYFPKHGDLDSIVYLWQAYSDSITAHPNWHPFNYLNNSYHRDTDMNNMIDCATTLLLSPGVAQIFYGDESLRELSDARFNVDSDQAFRSDMNWENTDSRVFNHFYRLGKIRQSHSSVTSGRQVTIDNHTCARISNDETIIIRVRPDECNAIIVEPYFNNGDILTDLYTETEAVVENGKVKFPHYKNNISIIIRK